MKVGKNKIYTKSDKSLDVAPEFEAFYQDKSQAAGGDVSKGVAALLGFMTLCAAMLLVLGLFFGARWVYRSMTDDKPAPVATTEESAEGVVATPDSESSSITVAPPTAATNSAASDSNAASSASVAGSSTSTLPSTAESAPITTIPNTGVSL